MRYANEGRYLLPQGSTTRTLPQEYHTNVTTGVPHKRYDRTVGLLHAHVTTRQVYVPQMPDQYHTLVTTGQCHTLVTTEQYHICCYHMTLPHARYHIGQYTTWLLPHDRLPHLLPQYHTGSMWYVWYSGTMHTGLIGILPQRSGRHYHMDHIDIVPHRSDRLATQIWYSSHG